MKKLSLEGTGKSKFSSRGVLQLAFVMGLLASSSAMAQTLDCYTNVGSGANSPMLTEIHVNVDKKLNVATGTWNGESVSTKLVADEDNLAEFVFRGGAEAGIWESDSSDENGAKKWTGFIFPSEESGMYRLNCKPREQTPLARN